MNAVGQVDIAEDVVDHPTEAGVDLNVDDVGVFVGEQQALVVVVGGEGRVGQGRGGEQVDQRPGERGGPAVGRVGVVGDHELDGAGHLPAEENRQVAVHLFGHGGHPPTILFEPLGEMHVEVFGFNRAVDQIRVSAS